MKQPPKRIREILEHHPDWDADITRNGHVKLTHPDGTIVFTSFSPSDHRAQKNLRSMLRRKEREAEEA